MAFIKFLTNKWIHLADSLTKQKCQTDDGYRHYQTMSLSYKNQIMKEILTIGEFDPHNFLINCLVDCIWDIISDLI